jgi:hypothetical protein
MGHAPYLIEPNLFQHPSDLAPGIPGKGANGTVRPVRQAPSYRKNEPCNEFRVTATEDGLICDSPAVPGRI